MKKICIVVLLLLMLPAMHAFAVDESEYVGTWVQVYTPENSGPDIEVFHLTEDHRLYFMLTKFDLDKVGFSREYAGQWSVISSSRIHVVWGNNVENDALIDEEGHLGIIIYDKYYPYVKVDDRKEKQTTGTYVPAGIWKVGEDIPAGTYSVRNADGVRSQNFSVQKDRDHPGFGNLLVNAILNSECPYIGKVELKDGYSVEVAKGVVLDAPVLPAF